MNEDFDKHSPRPTRRFRDDLTKLHTPPMGVPEDVTHKILARAERRLAYSRQLRLIVRTLATGSAASAILLAIVLFQSHRSETAPALSTTPVAVAPEDLDGNGAVDIRDAFLLARHMKAGTAKPTWDINHDGRVDKGDVDTIALAAVSLEKGAVQ